MDILKLILGSVLAAWMVPPLMLIAIFLNDEQRTQLGILLRNLVRDIRKL